ncbi:MAG TPA: hypothetical protein VHS31_10345, partial [Tepidisphaeraceae bacterium]|nr:hypothetical protein [Tepidisphaeraceae bacterium]
MAGGVIDLETPVSGLQATDAELQTWVLDAARAVGTYFGHFPIPRVHIIIAAGGHGDDPEGVTTDDDITVRIRSDFGKADMKRDWVMTHEMFHLAFPDMDDQYIWIREGLASYLEPLARSRVGQLSSEQVWSEWVEGMPQGQPEPGDMGLNHTHTWGRTYWGGSIFCLLADLRIREQTQNHRSLDDAMRAILTHGGNRLAHWPMDKVISIGDEATGTNVLRDLY